jgi:TetR/AcrR family transcriptional regulator, repressor for neighboring sulfatase
VTSSPDTSSPKGARKVAAKKAAPAKKVTPRKAATPTKTAAKKASTAKKVAPAKKTSPLRAKPRGREQVIDSIIDATLSMWTAQGTADLSLRSIAARADVNYGLVHRHFGSKEAVIRAAMDRVVNRSRDFVSDSDDLPQALRNIFPRSTGAHARLLAWSILQHNVDEVLPPEDVFLRRLGELADLSPGKDATASRLKVAAMISMIYGWRIYSTYLSEGLELTGTPPEKLDDMIGELLLEMLASPS